MRNLTRQAQRAGSRRAGARGPSDASPPCPAPPRPASAPPARVPAPRDCGQRAGSGTLRRAQVRARRLGAELVWPRRQALRGCAGRTKGGACGRAVRGNQGLRRGLDSHLPTEKSDPALSGRRRGSAGLEAASGPRGRVGGRPGMEQRLPWRRAAASAAAAAGFQCDAAPDLGEGVNPDGWEVGCSASLVHINRRCYFSKCFYLGYSIYSLNNPAEVLEVILDISLFLVHCFRK
ncbi:uncharacterized protein [Callorhinus ursinus]|uniref:uncharacterized protein n=1 Tax=Callorhinus ursinus TaxID=34884 RepID=UPI003CD036B0